MTISWSASDKLPFIPAWLYEQMPLLVSDTVNPNVMAGALVLVLPLAIALPLFAARSLRWFEWSAIVPALVTMAGILVLTQSRGGLLAFAAAMIVLLALRWRYGFVAAIIVGIILVGFGLTYGFSQINALFSDRTFAGFDNRFIIWSRALYMIEDHPFTGIGMGAFKQLLDSSYPIFLPTSPIPHAHNLFLQIAVDVGTPGLIAWTAILLLTTRGAWQVFRRGHRRRDAWMAGVGAALIAIEVALVTHGMMDAVVWGIPRTAVLVWVVWGLTAASQGLLTTEAPSTTADSSAIESSIVIVDARRAGRSFDAFWQTQCRV